MESKYEKVINIATGDTNIVIELIEWFNKTYKSDFKLVESEDRGGVEFAIVERGSSSLDEIFLLGFFYSGKIQKLRDEKKIDW